MKVYKRIIAYILIIAIFPISLVFPVFASDEHSSKVVTFSDQLLSDLVSDATELQGSFWGDVVGLAASTLSENMCSLSPDHYHHCNGVLRAGGSDVGGDYKIGACRYCGSDFHVYGSDLDDAYNSFTDSLPVDGINKDGQYVWRVKWSDLDLSSPAYIYCDSGVFGTAYSSDDFVPLDFSVGSSATFQPVGGQEYKHTTVTVESAHSLKVNRTVTTGSYIYGFNISKKFDLVAPVSGSYVAKQDYFWLCSSGYSTGKYSSSALTKSSGDVISRSEYSSGYSDSFKLPDYAGTSVDVWFDLPTYIITPSSELDADLYSSDTRVTVPISVVPVTDVDINTGLVAAGAVVTGQMFNEVTGNLTIGGQTYENCDWNYDYSTRTYDVTYQDNDNIDQSCKITYGDTTMSVTYGGNTYNYYYVTDGGGSEPSPSPSPAPSGDKKETLWDWITKTAGKVGDWLVDNILGTLGKIWQWIVDLLLDLIQKIISALGSMISFVLDFFEGIFSAPVDLVSGFNETISFWDTGKQYSINSVSIDISSLDSEAGDYTASTSAVQAIFTEAENHIGKPYELGASGPDKFDCSGFVCYVLNQTGAYPAGRVTAQGLYNMCTPITPVEAQPGDLIFFTGTYECTETCSHVGFYAGGTSMLDAGNPIGYHDFSTSYWVDHFYSFGRLNYIEVT